MSAEHGTSSSDHDHKPAPPENAKPENPFHEEMPLVPMVGMAEVLDHPDINGRGNSPVQRAALLQMQRTYGARAVQRYIQRKESSGNSVAIPVVQRHAEVGADAVAPDLAADELDTEPARTGYSVPLQRHPAGAGISNQEAAVAGLQAGGAKVAAPTPASGGPGGGTPTPAGPAPGGGGTAPTPSGPAPAGPAPAPAGPAPAPGGPVPAPGGPTPAPGTPAPAGTGPAAAPLPPESMSLARAQEVLTASYGSVHTIVQGSIVIVDGRTALWAKYDEINKGRNNANVTPPRPWQDGDAQQYIPGLEGFADPPTVYVNKNSVLPTVTAHEMLHANTAAGFRSTVGETINEGTTEHLALKALTAAGVSTTGTGGAVAYPQQVSMVRQLINVVGEGTLIGAYFGGPDTLVSAFNALKGPGSFATLRPLMEGLNAAGAAPLLSAPTIDQITGAITTLLADPVSDANIGLINEMVKLAQPTDLPVIQLTVSGRIIALAGSLLRGDPTPENLGKLERLMALPNVPAVVSLGVTPAAITAGNSLLDGWVSDNDIQLIRRLVNLPLVNKAWLQKALAPRIPELWSIGQRAELKVILDAG